MELQWLTFRESGFEVLGGLKDAYPKLSNGMCFKVSLPILRNVSNIEKGEVLCMPQGAEELMQ